MALAFLLTLAAAMTLNAAAVLAAAPEKPEALPPTEVKATTATLHGILDPGKEGGPFELDTYEFVYRQSPTACKGAGEIAAPIPAGMSLGGGKEEVSQAIEALTAHTEYTVCLVAHNEAKTETAVSPPVTFKTALPPETPETLKAEPVSGTSATLHGVLNPKAPGDPGTYEFLYRASETECEGEQSTETVGAAGGSQEPVSAVAKLLPVTEYTFCLLARNQAGETALGPPQTFTTPVAAPTVTGESVSGITATEVTLSAQLDPGGAPTTYQVEYEPGKRTPEQTLAASTTPVGVQQKLTGLTPATEYHVRFLAANHCKFAEPAQECIAEGSLVAFTTPAAGGAAALALPDGRAYEQVSAPGNAGVDVPRGPFEANGDIPSKYPLRASADGDAVAYLAAPPPEGGNGTSGAGLGNTYLAERTSEGWRTGDITPVLREGDTRGERLSEYENFTPDLSLQITRSESRSLALTAEPAGPLNCKVLYSHTGSATAGAYHALFTSAKTAGSCGEPLYAGGNEGTATVPKDSHLLLQSLAALIPEADKVSGEEGTGNLYDSVGGHLTLVNVLEGGAHPDATFGGPGESPGSGHEDFSNVISADGSRIFWTDLESGHIYVRENATSTVAVSAGAAQYWTASRDGRYAFYTENGELWRFDVENQERVALTPPEATGTGNLALGSDEVTALSTSSHFQAGEPISGVGIPEGTTIIEVTPTTLVLSSLTTAAGAGVPLTSSHPDVQGVVGTSEDGSYIYFVAARGLTADSTRRVCSAEFHDAKEEHEKHEEELGAIQPVKGCNLYVLHLGEPLRFIATLSPYDNEPSGNGRTADWSRGLANRTAEVTPDGRHLLFESTHRLTGYDTSSLDRKPGSSNGSRGMEVFLFGVDTGRVVCASCSPSGAPPDPEASNAEPVGTYLPPSSTSTSMLRLISSDGNRVFFDTRQPLVSRDSNGLQDVYEWEREGTGSCAVASTPSSSGGCIFLISGGSGTDASFFVDASGEGSNVFFTTRDRLVAQDGDEKIDLYDARVGGGFSQTSLACTGTGCQGVPGAPPTFATPSSATFNGAGNFPPLPPQKPKTAAQIRAEKLAKALKACHAKKNRRKRMLCEKQARAKYGPLKAKRTKRASHHRRAK